MIKMLLILVLNLLGFEENKPKYDLHKQKTGVTDMELMIIISIIGIILIALMLVFIGSCTDSGVFYNSQLY